MAERIINRSSESENWRDLVRQTMSHYQEYRNADPNFVIPSIFRVGRAFRHRKTELQAWKEFEANQPADYFE